MTPEELLEIAIKSKPLSYYRKLTSLSDCQILMLEGMAVKDFSHLQGMRFNKHFNDLKSKGLVDGDDYKTGKLTKNGWEKYRLIRPKK